ncbi:MAG: 6-carboxytetrahydropterin synthase [Nitrospira sp.]|jgi:6-pyruvoyltetrahydropterin/6-carboxytetrahydropterin synthase|nr:6-carboxytetrahydropterin synthase [Nitrospira sp.]
MSTVSLMKRIEFSSSHRYVKPEWDEAKNRAVFGACYNPPAHGHNYMLEVTVAGDVDPKTGMVINLFDLKRVLLDMIEEFDHKNFNLDMPYFTSRIPTSENIARVLWSKLESQPDIGALHQIRLWEDEDLSAEITAAGGPDVASVTRRYSFTAVLDGHQGHTWDCFVTVHGAIDPVTGMVTDIGALDRLMQAQVLQPFDRRHLGEVLGMSSLTGDQLAKVIWERLASLVSGGRLQKVSLVQTRDLTFEYAG